MRYFIGSLLSAGLLLAGCSGSKEAVEDETDGGEEPVETVEETEPPVEEEPAAVAVSPVVGDWEGALSLPNGGSLRVVFHITQDAAGTLAATVDSPDQGALGIPVDEVRFEEGELYLYLQVIDGSYTGMLQEEAGSIEGTWSQPGGALPLSMARAEN